MGRQSVEVVRGVYEAFGRGDVQAVLGALAEELEWHEAEGMPYAGLYCDREAVAEKVFGPLIEDVPDFEVSPGEFIASEDTVVALVRYTGTGKLTGKRLDLRVAHVWDVRDGKITGFRYFVDTTKFLEVVPAHVATIA